ERHEKEEAERKAREEAERKAKEDAARQEREASERKAKEEAERKEREDAERREKEEAERKAKEDAERKDKEAAEAKARAPATDSLLADLDAFGKSDGEAPAAAPVTPPPAPPSPPAAAGAADSLLADLDSFSARDDEEKKAQEEAERKAKEDAARKAKEDAERREREAEEARRREEEGKAAEAKRAQEEAERKAREEEEARAEKAAAEQREKEEKAAAEKRKRAAKAATAGAAAGAAAADDDIDISDDDIDMDDVRRDEKALGEDSRKAARKRERAERRREEGLAAEDTVAPVAPRKRRKWGKPLSVGLFVVLLAGVGLVHVMPLSTTAYEKLASEALGVPVKIGSANLSLITGVQLKFSRVSLGSGIKAAAVRGYPNAGSVFGESKVFSKMELEGLVASQEQLAALLGGAMKGDRFKVARVEAQQVKLDGPLALPPLDVTLEIAGDGSVASATLRGPEALMVRLAPKGAEIAIEGKANSLVMPLLPELTLSDFSMKGSATRDGLHLTEWDGKWLDGRVAGTARVQWGGTWKAEGEISARGVNVAVFAPALISEGRVEGRGLYALAGPAPEKMMEGAKLLGTFTISKGVLGSFDLARAIQTGGAQGAGRTLFAEMTGEGTFEKGVTSLRKLNIQAGALSAGASLDIAADGALSGRVIADVKGGARSLSATLPISGTSKEPRIGK
ncbi:MAG TPA: hypothetical protein VIS77_07395, partial [Burkholderiales bacterium]